MTVKCYLEILGSFPGSVSLYTYRPSETIPVVAGHWDWWDWDWWVCGLSRPREGTDCTMYCWNFEIAQAFAGHSDWWIGGFYKFWQGFVAAGLSAFACVLISFGKPTHVDSVLTKVAGSMIPSSTGCVQSTVNLRIVFFLPFLACTPFVLACNKCK